MQQQLPPMRAAIDIGSNTIHIVVARCKLDDLDIIEDQLELARIGESVTATGNISPEKTDVTISTLRRYQALAQQHNAQPILIVATEAIRQAHNSQQFLEQIKQQTGLQVHLINGNVEATLTFLGATYEQAGKSSSSSRLGVMDLGGGSMELVTAKGLYIEWRTSIPIGSGWLHDRYLPTNPPSPDDLAVAQIFLQTYLEGMHFKSQPSTLIVTGGSANSLLLLARQAFRIDPSTSILSYADLMHCEGILCALTAEEISQRYGQPIARARILPAGALIIRSVMSRLNLPQISVSPHGIREGVLLAYQRYGENWLESINEESANSLQNTNKEEPLWQTIPGTETVVETAFIDSGKRMLAERIDKLLDWPDEILHNEDIEAVHKMRVATRRLRATLDAFKMCCEPKEFKKTYRHIKKIADLLGEARDTDVMLQGLHCKLEEAPSEERSGIQWLIQRLKAYRQQIQQDLQVYFTRLDEQALRKQVESCIQEGN
jgi:Ppx/GppA phosphatase family/CHAD domain